MNFQSFYSSPIGTLLISSNQDYITGIYFPDAIRHSNNCITDKSENPNRVIRECHKQLNEYFSGIRKVFDVPYVCQGTEFQKRVWAELCLIPYGKRISYLSLADRLGDVKAIRAVGTSNGKNPVSIIVPCHRVIGSNGKLVGYGGDLWRKKWLLDHETKFESGVQQLSAFESAIR